MKPIVNQVKELIEASEPDMTVIEMNDELFACPHGIALWQQYRSRNPDGLKVPPADLTNCTDRELSPTPNISIPAMIATRYDQKLSILCYLSSKGRTIWH